MNDRLDTTHDLIPAVGEIRWTECDRVRVRFLGSTLGRLWMPREKFDEVGIDPDVVQFFIADVNPNANDRGDLHPQNVRVCEKVTEVWSES